VGDIIDAACAGTIVDTLQPDKRMDASGRHHAHRGQIRRHDDVNHGFTIET